MDNQFNKNPIQFVGILVTKEEKAMCRAEAAAEAFDRTVSLLVARINQDDITAKFKEVIVKGTLSQLSADEGVFPVCGLTEDKNYG